MSPESVGHDEDHGVPPVVDHRELHRLEIPLDGHTAYLNYQHRDGHLVVIHTEVPVALREHGLAARLAAAAFAKAAAEGLRVRVICPYVAVWLQRHPLQQALVD